MLSILGTGCSKEVCAPYTPAAVAPVRGMYAEGAYERDVAALFGRTPAGGILPKQVSWSPDGEHVAYLRKYYDKSGEHHSELWLYNAATKQENPIFAKDKKQISSYTWCTSSRLIVAADGDLFAVGTNADVVQVTRTEAEENFPTASPDGSRVAFLRNGDIFVLSLLSGEESRVTSGASNLRVFGEAPRLYQEEFDTATGMGWSPNGRYLWFFDTDLSRVSFRDIPQADGTTVKMPYPRPGEPNPSVRIASVDFETAPPSMAYLAAGKGQDCYLPRVSVHPDSRRLLVTRMDRLQTVMEILSCPMNGSPCTVAVSEQDPRFVNLQTAPKILPGGREMLFLSERSGFAHIYRVALDGGEPRAVTEGPWTVTRINGVDESARHVFFTADIEDPMQCKLYRMPLEGEERQAAGFSSAPGCHEALFSPDGKRYLDTHSALNRPPKTDVRTADGKFIGTLDAQGVSRYSAEDVVSDLFPVPTKHGRLNAMLTRPAAVRQGEKYPVMVIVYGGPHVRLAENRFHSTYQPLRDLLARRGILVFTVDGRGSSGRGHDFDAAVRLSLGRLELEDQLLGVEYLKSLPFVDPERIGVFGWSYGGYMALGGLLRSDAFSMGIAVAPVTDWRLYDSAYTERYMQRPSDNPDGYDKTALPPLADKLNAPLLLVHGISDDNVHFVHSARMFDALLDANKRFETIFFPGGNHALEGPTSRVYLFSRVMRFIEENL